MDFSASCGKMMTSTILGVESIEEIPQILRAFLPSQPEQGYPQPDALYLHRQRCGIPDEHPGSELLSLLFNY